MDISPALIAAKNAIAAAISGLPGVWGADVGLKEDGEGGLTDETVIRVLVEDLNNVHPFVQAAIATSVFPVVIVERHFEPLVDTQMHRPLIGGISVTAEHGGLISNFGTLGGFARVTPLLMQTFPGVFAGNELLGISNAHVLAKNSTGPQMGDRIIQPSSGPGARQIGTLLWWSERLDAAVFRLLPTEPALQQIKPAIPTNGRAQQVFLQSVRKRGASTGQTNGRICTAEPAFSSPSLPSGIFEVFRDLSEPVFCDHGDSGSLVLNDSNQIVGLLFAGDIPPTIGTASGFAVGWVIPITPICQELLIDF